MTEKPHYVFEGEPVPGETREAAPGVLWLRMTLPFKLDHINLWLLADGDGWTAVDTGIARDETKAAWEKIAADRFRGRPLKRLIVTHFHPDHVGLAGWMTERFDVPLWMPIMEWGTARTISQDTSEETHAQAMAFYRRSGFDAGQLATFDGRRNRYAANVSPIPASFRRYGDGDEIDIDGKAWRVIVGTGHSPEHACLYCEALNVLISGDQILPRISPNVSVWPGEPEADPLARYLRSLKRFRGLPAETLVLPSHDWPFLGLPGRLDALAHHHDERLEETFAACAVPSTGTEVLKRLFTRELDPHQLMFAIGESLSHLNHLIGQGRVRREQRTDGVLLYRQAG